MYTSVFSVNVFPVRGVGAKIYQAGCKLEASIALGNTFLLDLATEQVFRCTVLAVRVAPCTRGRRASLAPRDRSLQKAPRETPFVAPGLIVELPTSFVRWTLVGKGAPRPSNDGLQRTERVIPALGECRMKPRVLLRSSIRGFSSFPCLVHRSS